MRKLGLRDHKFRWNEDEFTSVPTSIPTTAYAAEDDHAYHRARGEYDHWLKHQGSKVHHALNTYGGSAAFHYNQHLRRHKGKVHQDHQFFHNHLQHALSHPLSHNTSVWRGDGGNHVHKLKVGETVRSHTPISTTYDAGTAEGFGERHRKKRSPKPGEATHERHVYLSKIHVPAGTHVGMPQHDHERELTLKHGTHFTVTGKEKHVHNGTTYHITHLAAHQHH